MDAFCNEIREKLRLSGWNPKLRVVETLGGDTVWVVFSKQAGRSFSTQAGTPQEAWESAWQLVGKIQKPAEEPQMILPFPVSVPSYHRAA